MCDPITQVKRLSPEATHAGGSYQMAMDDGSDVGFSIYSRSSTIPEDAVLTGAINVCRLHRRFELGRCIGFALDKESSGRLGIYNVVPLYAPGPGTMPVDADRTSAADIYSIEDCL